MPSNPNLPLSRRRFLASTGLATGAAAAASLVSSSSSSAAPLPHRALADDDRLPALVIGSGYGLFASECG